MSKPQVLVNDPLEAVKRGAVPTAAPGTAAPPGTVPVVPTPPAAPPTPTPPPDDTRAPSEPDAPPPEPVAPVQYRVKVRKDNVSLGTAGAHTLHKGKVLSVEFYAEHKDRLAEQGVELEVVPPAR
jgi:hypothetical protein